MTASYLFAVLAHTFADDSSSNRYDNYDRRDTRDAPDRVSAKILVENIHYDLTEDDLWVWHDI
ncbi:hypothetical protein CJF30_00002141 [Rutstroemia sp. NJR-2017a BBW]|nr:hypothetical protein CJF30_00002141 [Rutstroemia sp. NJR-2017a BBW]